MYVHCANLKCLATLPGNLLYEVSAALELDLNAIVVSSLPLIKVYGKIEFLFKKKVNINLISFYTLFFF